jgi:hypothetical protein
VGWLTGARSWGPKQGRARQRQGRASTAAAPAVENSPHRRGFGTDSGGACLRLALRRWENHGFVAEQRRRLPARAMEWSNDRWHRKKEAAARRAYPMRRMRPRAPMTDGRLDGGGLRLAVDGKMEE